MRNIKKKMFAGPEKTKKLFANTICIMTIMPPLPCFFPEGRGRLYTGEVLKSFACCTCNSLQR